MLFAGILAGGTGSRMKGSVPKQFLDLNGRPLIVHTLQPFLEQQRFEKIYVGLNRQWFDYGAQLINTHLQDQRDRIELTVGGDDRMSTLLGLIHQIYQDYGQGDHVLVSHDAARPFVSSRIIEDHLRLLGRFSVINTAISAVDTILQSNDGVQVDAIPNRAVMYQTQTPQTFHTEDFLRHYECVPAELKNQLTDACGLFLAHGQAVGIVQGDVLNFKVTTALDLCLAQAILNEKREKNDKP